MTWEPDGSLTVRFRACGWLEMAWFLYQWGKEVEVLEPEGLAELVHPARRDFDALP
jgi:predicted DNA-binding transcriptional regulator YafY